LVSSGSPRVSAETKLTVGSRPLAASQSGTKKVVVLVMVDVVWVVVVSVEEVEVIVVEVEVCVVVLKLRASRASETTWTVHTPSTMAPSVSVDRASAQRTALLIESSGHMSRRFWPRWLRVRL